jgi:hypothetical protein
MPPPGRIQRGNPMNRILVRPTFTSDSRLVSTMKIAFNFALAVLLCCAGCNKSGTTVDATKPLAESFQVAAPEVKHTIQTVNTRLTEGNYFGAAQAMEPVLTQPNLTEAQKHAISLALSQINQAVAANPSLDSKEFYAARARMFQAMRGKSRF